MLKIYDDIKVDFFLIVEQILAFTSSIELVGKVKNFLQISNELQNDITDNIRSDR